MSLKIIIGIFGKQHSRASSLIKTKAKKVVPYNKKLDMRHTADALFVTDLIVSSRIQGNSILYHTGFVPSFVPRQLRLNTDIAIIAGKGRAVIADDDFVVVVKLSNLSKVDLLNLKSTPKELLIHDKLAEDTLK